MTKTKGKKRVAEAARKVVILLGSPRKTGNSAALAEAIADGAALASAEIDVFYLHGMKIAPCNACEACHKSGVEGCVIDDDMQELYPKLRRADAIVFAGPVYWFTMSAQTKLALDRCYALLEPGGGHAFTGKRIGLAFSFGGEDAFDSGCVNAIRAFQDAFRFIGAEITGIVYASASGPGDIRTNEKVMTEARDLGRRLALP
jgi:multimeric flavodoxin WrbA